MAIEFPRRVLMPVPRVNPNDPYVMAETRLVLNEATSKFDAFDARSGVQIATDIQVRDAHAPRALAEAWASGDLVFEIHPEGEIVIRRLGVLGTV